MAQQSGYVPCACRDCMEIAIADRSKPLAYCHECETAGCPDYQGQRGMSQECKAPGAYGCTDEVGYGEPFCACGKRWSDCDGSRAKCHRKTK